MPQTAMYVRGRANALRHQRPEVRNGSGCVDLPPTVGIDNFGYFQATKYVQESPPLCRHGRESS